MIFLDTVYVGKQVLSYGYSVLEDNRQGRSWPSGLDCLATNRVTCEIFTNLLRKY